MYESAVAAADPGPATARAVDALRIDRDRRVWIFAVGKAAHAMAGAAATSLLRSLHSVVGGVVVSPEGGPSPYPTLLSLRGDHPIPGANSSAAAAKIAEVSAGRRGTDVAIVLISGGASSLIGAPVRGMNEADLTRLYELLLGSGLDIAQTNVIRKRFSRWGAGRLALALAPAATFCLAVSDVAGDDLAVIGSGPCVPDGTTVREVTEILQRANLLARIPQTHRDYLTAVSRGTIPETPTRTHPAFAHVTAKVISNNTIAVEGAATRARECGLEVELLGPRLAGEAARLGDAIARHLIDARAGGAVGKAFIWGGEPTVTLGALASHSGGGRCQELALAAARTFAQAGEAAASITLIAAGTDGRDGATDAAGAVVDGATWAQIAAAGRDPNQALAAHESNAVLKLANAIIARRDTGTNVNDVVIGLV